MRPATIQKSPKIGRESPRDDYKDPPKLQKTVVASRLAMTVDLHSFFEYISGDTHRDQKKEKNFACAIRIGSCVTQRISSFLLLPLLYQE